ncbi:MAG: enoyl-CoA hydratase/isomerase family protein [Pseudomonadota bacterium]
MTAPAEISAAGPVGVIELSRPEKFNALTPETFRLIDDARVRFEADREIRALLIRARGEHFCTGADLAAVKSTLPDAAALDHFLASGHDALSRLEASPLPVVCAVQGLCLAGGLELMLAADICLAARSARFGDQHAQFGLIPGWGGSQRLTRVLGLRRAMDLFLTARWITAEEALAMGLVNRIAEDAALHEDAQDLCETLATRSRTGLAEMKRLARQGLDLPLPDALKLEREAAARALPGPDAAEGLAAFEARRKPDFP